MEPVADLRRELPAVDEVLRRPAVVELCDRYGRAAVGWHLRAALDEARRAASAGDRTPLDRLETTLAARLATDRGLRPVLNATGVVVHTNLGRAPLPSEAVERVAEVARGYSTLEFDLESGERGERGAALAARLRRLVGAEAALVVNNNAAAVLLALDTLARGREVVVSRGELVEIGGAFRVPDVLARSGARMIEVGTTNRTRLADYRAAIGPETGLLLKVHPSNFRIVGFTESVGVAELSALARQHGVPVVEDLGSGALRALPEVGEPTVQASLAAGADLVTFSGDKLLGGPQAGLVAGRASLVGALHRNALYRALRVDKMTIAALDAVLDLYERGLEMEIPVPRMLQLTREDLRPRAERVRVALLAAGLPATLRDGVSAVGGGAAPTVELPTLLVALPHSSAHVLAQRLRAGDPPVVGRVAEDALLLDLRTVDPEDDARLADAVARALRT